MPWAPVGQVEEGRVVGGNYSVTAAEDNAGSGIDRLEILQLNFLLLLHCNLKT